MLVGENREDVTVTDGRRRADRFDTDVVCGVADALAPATVGRAGVCRGETDDFERGLSAEIEDGAQFDVVVVVDEPDGFFDAPALRGETPRGPFVYFLNEGHPGTVIEMAELTPTRRRIFDAVREAAIDWDGSDPVRYDWPRG